MDFISDISFVDADGDLLNFTNLNEDIVSIDVNGVNSCTLTILQFTDMVKLLSEIVEGRI